MVNARSKLFKPVLKKIKPENIFTEKTWLIVRIAFSFQLVCLGYLIFRASSITQTYNMLISIFSNFHLHGIGLEHMASQIVFYIGILVVVQIVQYCKNDQMIILKSNILVRAIFYCICFYLLIFYGASGGQEFIYLQF